jgi:hypothetical protein
VPVPGATGSSLVLVDVTLQDRGIWCVEVYNACSSASSCTRLSMSECGSYCTLTQGGYGNPNGKWNGMNRIELLTNLLAQGPLVIGEAGRSVTINPGQASALCIIANLPAGGAPASLPDFGDQTLDPASCQTNPPLPEQGDHLANVLLGQTLALALNLRLDPDLATVNVCTQMTTSNGVYSIDSNVISAMTQFDGGNGVENLLAFANHALAGGGTNGVSLGSINDAVSAINQAFDECANLLDCQ